jgi:hypothetical protein
MVPTAQAISADTTATLARTPLMLNAAGAAVPARLAAGAAVVPGEATAAAPVSSSGTAPIRAANVVSLGVGMGLSSPSQDQPQAGRGCVLAGTIGSLK